MAVARVFISYSSDDEGFAHGLHVALKARHKIWLDSRAIPAGTDFRASIDPALEACECLVVVRSPAWLASEVCRYEAARAAEWRKRIVPVEPARPPRGLAWPPALDGLSPIGFWREAGRASALKKLRHDLEADHAWLAAHAELLVDALRWQRSGGLDRRLRGSALREAMRMVERAAAGAASPELLPVQRDYVQACEESEAAEVVRLTQLNRRAVSRHLAAEAQRLWAEHPSNIGLALRLAAESLRRAPGTVARDLAARLVKLAPRTLATLPGTAGARRLRWSRDGQRLAVALAERVQVWHQGELEPIPADVPWPGDVHDMRFDGDDLVVLDNQGQVQRLSLRHGTTRAVRHADGTRAWLSPDGRRVAWASHATLWLASTVEGDAAAPQRFELPHRVQTIALSPAGPQVAVFADGTVHLRGAQPKHLLRLIDTDAGTWIDLDSSFRMNLEFSEDGCWLNAQTYMRFDVWRVADGQHMVSQDGRFEAWLADAPALLFSRAVMRRTDEEHAPQERRLMRRRIAPDDEPAALPVRGLDGPFSRLRLRQRECLAGRAGVAACVVDLRLGTSLAIVEQTSVPALAAEPRFERLATVSNDDPVRIFDFAVRQARRWGPYVAAIGSVATSADGRWLARALEHADASMWGALPVEGASPRGWDTEGRVGALAVSCHGRVAAVLAHAKLVSAAGTRCRGEDALAVGDATGLRLWPRDKASTAVAIAPDGRHVVELLHDGRVVWLQPDAPGAAPRLLDQDGAKAIRLDASGRWLLMSGAAHLAVHDLDEGAACVLRREGVACAAFDASSGRTAPGLWVAEVGGVLRRLSLPSGRSARRLAWVDTPQLIGAGDSPRTLWLAQGSALLWIETRGGSVQQRIELGDEVRQVQPSPSGRHLWVATRRGEGSAWRMPEGERCMRLNEPYATVAWLAGDQLAVRDGAAFRIESLSLEALLAEADARAGPGLREHEWRAYLPDEPWPGAAQAGPAPAKGAGTKPR